MTASGFTDQGSITPDNLFAGESPRFSRKVVIEASGFPLLRGTVLGRITSSGNYTLSDITATNGSETPDAILAETLPDSFGNIQAIVYLAGCFNESALIYGPGHSAETIRNTLRNKSIFLAKNQDA